MMSLYHNSVSVPQWAWLERVEWAVDTEEAALRESEDEISTREPSERIRNG